MDTSAFILAFINGVPKNRSVRMFRPHTSRVHYSRPEALESLHESSEDAEYQDKLGKFRTYKNEFTVNILFDSS